MARRSSFDCASRFPSPLWVALPLLAGLSACSGGTTVTDPISPPGATTTVTLLSTSTANDQLTSFRATLHSLKLTNRSGSSTELIASPVNLELVHTNGIADPIVTATIPQDRYVSATASIGSASFTCYTLGSDGYDDGNWYGYKTVPANDVTVTLPAPITAGATGLILDLDLLMSQSASLSSCASGNAASYSISPAFSLTALNPPSSGTSLRGLVGVVQSTGAGNVITVSSADGDNYGNNSPSGAMDPAGPAVWQVQIGPATRLEGVATAGELGVGMPVEIEGSLQPDGTLTASRIAVYDSDPTEASLWTGPFIRINSDIPNLATVYPRQNVGPLLAGNAVYIDYGSSAFAISGSATNLAALPFTPVFDPSTMVAGQNAVFTFHQSQLPQGAAGPDATTITLIPQSLDGIVIAIGQQGSFATYTIQLAPYDLFSIFAVQPLQTTVLTNPSTVVVYADSSTQQLNTNPVSVGATFRFYGLVFNDSGNLRMDCAQINDGVPQ